MLRPSEVQVKCADVVHLPHFERSYRQLQTITTENLDHWRHRDTTSCQRCYTTRSQAFTLLNRGKQTVILKLTEVIKWLIRNDFGGEKQYFYTAPSKNWESFWLECQSQDWEVGVQSPTESHQKLQKWYQMPRCPALSIKGWIGSKSLWHTTIMSRLLDTSILKLPHTSEMGALWISVTSRAYI